MGRSQLKGKKQIHDLPKAPMKQMKLEQKTFQNNSPKILSKLDDY